MLKISQKVLEFVLVGFMFLGFMPDLVLGAKTGFELSSDLVGEEWVGVPVLIQANFTEDETGESTSYLTLSDGDNNGTFYNASSDGCGEAVDNNQITIESDFSVGYFCYMNPEAGDYTIKAELSFDNENNPLEDYIDIAFKEPDIVLNLLENDSFPYADENILSFTGMVYTNDGGPKEVKTMIYVGSECDGDPYSTSSSTLDNQSEEGYDFTYFGEFGSISPGQYSLQSVLYTPTTEEIAATSQCLIFNVTEVEEVIEGHLTVYKEVTNWNNKGFWSFDFTGDAGNFNLTNEGVKTERDLTVTPGLVAINEAKNEDWKMTAVRCEYVNKDGVEIKVFPTNLDLINQTFTIDVSETGTTDCYVTSDYEPVGHLTVYKEVTNWNNKGFWSFDFTGDAGNFNLTNEGVKTERDLTVPTGLVNISEAIGKNWKMSSVRCEYKDEKGLEIKVFPTNLDLINQTFTIDVLDTGTTDCYVTNNFIKNNGGGTRVKKQALLTVPLAPTVSMTATTTKIECSLLLKDYLHIGWNNNPIEVIKLQKFLSEQGIFVPVTGFFGTLTEGAVKLFQAKYPTDILSPWSLTAPTGFVYKTTVQKINQIACVNN